METLDRRAAANREIDNIKQSTIRLMKILTRERPGGRPPDDDPSDDDLPNHDPPPNNGWWQPIFDFFANMWGSIKSTFWGIFN
jgi:hypothetical protein